MQMKKYIYLHLNNQEFIPNSLSYISFTPTANSRHYHPQKFLILWLTYINILKTVSEPILCLTDLTAPLEMRTTC